MQAYILTSNLGMRFRFGEALGAYTKAQNNAQRITVSEYLHSDALWSALVNAWAFCHPESVENFIAECRNGSFKLSSIFYCVDYHGKQVFFLPKPVSLNLIQSDESSKSEKIKFISKGIWESGCLPKEWFDPNKCTLLQNESMVALKSEINTPINLFAIETLPKVRARNLNDREDALFYETNLFLLNGENYQVNWYFITENNLPENLQDNFKDAMQTLVNLGIGGDRSSGCGSLTEYRKTDFIVKPDVSQSQTSTTNYRASLSLIAPNENELNKNSLYQIIKRGGRPLEKNNCLPMIQMLREGAVFDTEIKGRIVTLSNNPPILRYGMNLDIHLHNNFINN